MVQASQTSVIVTSVVIGLILIIGMIAGFSSVKSDLGNKLDVMNEHLKGLDIDEQAIANGIVAGITMPTMPEIPDLSKVDDLWEGVYSDKIKELEDDAKDVGEDQFFEDNEYFAGNYPDFGEDDEVFDLLVDEYEDDEDYEGVWAVKWIKKYEDKREIEVINLGLEDEDDRLVELSTVIRVKVFYDVDDGEEYFFDKVFMDSIVTSDDGDLEAEITYSI